VKTENAVLAFQRFGLGAKHDGVAALAGDRSAVRKALLDEAHSKADGVSFEGLPTSAELLVRLIAYRDQQQAARARKRENQGSAAPMAEAGSGGEAMTDRGSSTAASPGEAKSAAAQPGPPTERNPAQESVRAELAARVAAAASAPIGFRERLALFWSNHFTVAATNQRVRILAGSFEREAIRPHLTGRFEDMLLAVESHPAMLFYLDNERSFGPNSQAGQRRSKGLNENLAREILELHTVGADAGYSQADVTRFAEILTGWTVVGPKANGGPTGTFIFRPQMHEPGARTVMGRSYAQEGVGQGRAVLRDLARHPSTARHVATKLCRHFLSDTPPKAAVDAVETAFTRSNGRLPALYEALLASETAFAMPATKLRTPYEYVMALVRAFDLAPDVQRIMNGMRLMGQPPFQAPSPKGWPDDAAAWAAPDAIKTRLDIANSAAQRILRAEPLQVAERLYGPLLSDETRTMLRRAESKQQAVALLLMSPEFQRR
jgi:uncharacterized protein (DUF1800 family)